MATPLRLPRVAVLCAALLAVMAPAAERVVDLRYGIPTWHQPLGLPNDWHKPMADERGALLYDFGPGPYVQPSTSVAAGAAGEPFTLAAQDWTDSPRFPALRTRLTRGADAIEITTFALPPENSATSDGRTAQYERLDGITGALGWAKPAPGVSPEFRNVAWGINRPLRYRIRVTPGAAKRVMLGFCESYKVRIGDRIAEMHVEGAPELALDIALNAPLNQPQVFLFDAEDTNRDGWLDIAIIAPQGHDPNTTLATIAVYPAGLRVTRNELVAGALTQPDRAELRIACGTEVRRQPARTDVLHAHYSGKTQPVLTIKTGRELTGGGPESGGLAASKGVGRKARPTPEADGDSSEATAAGGPNDELITENGAPFLLAAPRPVAVAKTESGYRLEFAPGTKDVTAWVFLGHTGEADVAAARTLTPETALAKARARWKAQAIPYDQIAVADPKIQAFVDASIRTLYQARESINGQSQFDSSFSLYRGLWAGDAVYLTTLAAQLGDSATGRQTFDALFQHQNANGIIDELHPQKIFRTTAEVLWGIARDAEISADWSYARAHWEQIRRAVAGIRGLRDSTLADPSTSYAGMLPPGFSDGGIMDIGAEYTSVYCTITGLYATERMAKVLGFSQDATNARKLGDEIRAAYERHRKRDQRRDSHGNLYLPVRVGFKGPDPIPQLTQYGLFDAYLNGGGWIPADFDLLQGTLGVMESVKKQGLPVSLGWMPGGNWVGMGLFIAFQPLLFGHDQETADMLYAAANHASPRGTWVEEQSLIGDPLKLAGDQPHCFAAAMFAQLTGSMLAYDHNDSLHLLGSVPAEWLHAGAVNRLEGWHTGAGTVTLSLRVSPDGKDATLHVEPVQRADKPIRIFLHTASLAYAGFRAENATVGSLTLAATGETPRPGSSGRENATGANEPNATRASRPQEEPIEVQPGKPVDVTFRR